VEHRTFVKPFHLVLSKVSPFASFQLIPTSCRSLYVALFQVVLGLPLFIAHWGFQSSACPSVASCGLRNVWPIHCLLLSFICCPIGVCFVVCHNSSFRIFSSHLTFKIRRRHRFTDTWSELLIRLVIFYVSRSYSKTGLTFVLNNRILGVRYFYSSISGTSARRSYLPSWYDCGHPTVPPYSVTVLQIYIKDLTGYTSLISLVLNSFILSHTFAASVTSSSNLAFISLRVCASKQMSSAEWRSSNLRPRFGKAEVRQFTHAVAEYGSGWRPSQFTPFCRHQLFSRTPSETTSART
jgi:hypothetical protein